ncbi:MAG: hypothetical protein KDD62_07640, partial [Bdellovibrionales bacterium]|nr:hypothetical protein [Bdellovibrionales bacterium]
AQCSLNSAWQRAKDQNDATLAMPAFQDIIDIRRLEVESRGFEGGDYETYLEFVEPEIPLQSLKDLIFPTSAQLFSYVPKAVALQQSHGPLLELPCIPSQTLNDIIVHVVSDLGFDLTRGTIEPSTTSCCVPISEGKVRLFYSEKTNFLDTILSAIHEAGHGMYDQGKGDNACPTNQLISMGLHESQARFWECMVGKSRGFMQYLHGVLLEHAPESTREITPDTLWRYANAVSPQELRIGSDDLTYNQHIVVRMIVEEALVSGELDAVNLPIRWNELYEQYLQLNPASDVVGVLQDLHWLDGHFGYFTSYALGNIFAAQLYWAMQGELGNQEFLVEQGNFKDIHQWLASNIYRNGCRLNSFDLIEKVTGAMPSGQLLVAHVVEALGL